MDVIAKTKDGKEIFRDSKIFMTQATNSRDDSMIYGPSFKVGYTRDTSLQPLKTREMTYEIQFPYEDTIKEVKKIREIKVKQMDVAVELRYQLDPEQGELNKDSFVFYRTIKTVVIQ